MCPYPVSFGKSVGCVSVSVRKVVRVTEIFSNVVQVTEIFSKFFRVTEIFSKVGRVTEIFSKGGRVTEIFIGSKTFIVSNSFSKI